MKTMVLVSNRILDMRPTEAVRRLQSVPSEDFIKGLKFAAADRKRLDRPQLLAHDWQRRGDRGGACVVSPV